MSKCNNKIITVETITPFSSNFNYIVKLALKDTSILQITVYKGQPHFSQ